jgi:lipopolysaccharide export system protein LptA
MTSLMALALLVALAPQDRPDAGPDSLKGQIFQESKPVDIRSDSLKIFHKDRYGLFTGHVVADRKDVQLHCDELRAEYDEKGLVERLICDGSVRVLMGQKEARGRKAVLSNVEEIITLTGDPSLKDGDDFMQGEVVVFDLAKDTVQIEKPRGKYKTRPREGHDQAPRR